MTDVCALHLSYVVENHSLPKQLLPYVPAKAGPSGHKLESSDTPPGCQGIVYLHNAELSKAGTRVLEVAELVRRGEGEGSSDEDPSPSKPSSRPAQNPPRTLDAGFAPLPRQPRGGRRGSLSSAGAAHARHAGGPWSATRELERARTRIQIGILKDAGAHSVALWGASLKLLSLARAILLEKPELQVNVAFGKGLKPTYASKLMAGTAVPNAPKTPVFKFVRPGSTLPASASASVPPSPLPTGTLQPSTAPVTINSPPKTPLMPSALPEAIWRRIIALASGAEGVVSSNQQESIIQWAKSRDTLRPGREVRGRTGSEHIWRVLEGMRCLSYDVKT